MGRPARVGMIVPSSNTCLEPQTYRILGDREDVTVHFTRVEVTRIALDGEAGRQFDHSAMVAAARLLRTADVDVIAWNGTAGSWLGPEHDRELVERITQATGVPATTSTLAYLDAFARFGLTRLGLVTPYTGDVNTAIIERYAAEGVRVVAEHHLGLDVNESFARVRPEELLVPSLELAGDRRGTPEALIYLCTNLYGAPIAERVEAETGLAALDSVAVTLWRCLTMAGLPGLASRWGRLLT
ncbi:maleate cis-trans isomerase family protein [Pseudonocardia kunmingensis]|uniref:Maleate isomerase n=1 Tax=Pseudonocardia kunmingensis TaxID=630975 RepID=A0A543CXI2_9PSEU|nr:aspartate/glutamate racemase family protein [Pseudonocardia kunmingensis]TQM01826.1 maleate isomerase [Pseudonocardia kunmingensis]